MKRLSVILLFVVMFPIISFAQSTKHSSNYEQFRLTNNNFHNLQLQDSTRTNTKTPIHFDAIAVEGAGGMVAGIFLGELLQSIKYLGFFGGLFDTVKKDEKSLKNDLDFYFPLYSGMIVGSALFVNYIGDRRGENGSFWKALSGGAIGFLVGFPINETLKFIAPSIGATIAYNLTRKPITGSSSGSSFVSIKNGYFKLSIPQMSFKIDTSGGSGLIQSVNLMRISF